MNKEEIYILSAKQISMQQPLCEEWMEHPLYPSEPFVRAANPDFKPYIPYGDARPEARSGFLADLPRHRLEVHCDPELLDLLPAGKGKALLDSLALDPRPAYQDNPDRVYGLSFMEYEVHFQVKDQVLHVLDLKPR